MDFISLDCPKCGGLLPRQARWRMINCPYCGRTVTLCEEVVQAVNFHQAWLRSQTTADSPHNRISISGKKYRIIAPLGSGDSSDVFLAERLNILPERVIIKLKKDTAPAGILQSEYDILCGLQDLDVEGAAYFSQRLPQPVSIGAMDDSGREALVLREPVGFWGSLEDVLKHHTGGVDPRHSVWMWRRILEVLGFLHDNGWSHGDIRTEHLLIHPDDHGILLIGWNKAAHSNHENNSARDLMQSAWAIREMLSGETRDEPGFGKHTPDKIVEILKRASEDAGWCAAIKAQGIDEALKAAAFESYGPPVFIPFSPVTSIEH